MIHYLDNAATTPVRPEAAQAALDRFQTACPEAELTLLRGAQPVYHYLISVE